MRVFLGGTCSGYDWRKNLIDMIDCDYYNPIVEDWSEADRIREVFERESDDCIVYVITSGIEGVYSIAEVVDDANNRPDKTIFCVLTKGMNKKMKKSIEAVMNLVSSKGVPVCDSLDKLAKLINARS